MGPWSDWILRGLTFLVVSCPCARWSSRFRCRFSAALAERHAQACSSRGSNYLEVLAKVDTVVFDKTGTLTQGSFDVVAVHSQQDIDPAYLLSMAAHAEAYSDHPIAASLKAAYTGDIDSSRVADVTETSATA